MPADASGLDRDSVALVTQLGPLNREYLQPHPVGHLPSYLLGRIGAGVRLMAGI